MPGPLYFKPGAPTVGMRRQDLRYPSLHGHSLRQPEKSRESSPSIHAPPRGSSSDEEFDGQEILDRASDDSEFGRSEKKGALNGAGMPRPRTDSRPANGEDRKKREPSVEPSNIRPASFTTGIGPGSRNGSQSSQKRNNIDVDDDDDISVAFSQKKKPRQSYGSTNIYKGSVTKPGSPKKIPPKNSGKAGPAYKESKCDAMLAQGRGLLSVGRSTMNTADLE